MTNFMRQMFRVFNKVFMVPMFRFGLGPFMGNNVSGYIMVIKTIGRKTGKVRYTPVNYAIQNGNVYCISGWGHRADWYYNIKTAKGVEIILPGGSIYGDVEDITDLKERTSVIRKILQNAGFAGFFEGFNPYTAADDLLARKTNAMPLIRIHPLGIGSGAFDPGGFSSVWTVAFILLVIFIIISYLK
jgi:deazaflavin-dependent oxidoreductase (nitroreductase family)